MNLYGSYSESSRVPTPIELACNEYIFDLMAANALAAGEDPDDIEYECRLPNAFLADPPLEQVVTWSFEFGARGKMRDIRYQLGFFHSVNNDDIIFQTTGRATGLFANVKQTQRRGFESGFFGNIGKLDWFLAYSYLQATFEDNFDVLSPNHPWADPRSGTLAVRTGDHIPGVPDHQLKLGGDYIFNDALSLGLELLYNSEQFLRGDEANRLRPVDDYAVVNLRGRYHFNRHIELFARINNLSNTAYETFGLLGESPDAVDLPLFQAFSNPRYLGPGAPRSVFAGIRISM
jgi:outer membrane receptor protein involved in Fe transport